MSLDGSNGELADVQGREMRQAFRTELRKALCKFHIFVQSNG